ncbi:MAG: hypothetical protein BECKG1743D_GA0114223_103622 [Candidatus Kentron sp. G]|nr:MAG: hypothetical protein BECKG1743F_GA0114225_104252 [Candidatus Kentron sp. G]VFN02056.1 MAG: hypothetical protein BECKG1743E_GA0114224_104672 [Candidatus Kentron sp. G]VFN02403.1 MAG: hypothetical protein BECKG1743D_GA0114223_103622 [Candidatus Kentron sp. G]
MWDATPEITRAVTIKADRFPSPDPVFACSRGECKRADFIIVADTGRKRIILCIEMKATNAQDKGIIQQLKGAQCFVGYCREVGRLFWQARNFLGDYQYRFVSISHIGASKARTRIAGPKVIHDKPENMFRIPRPGQRLEFKHLV